MRVCNLVTFDVVNTIIKVRGSPGFQYAKVARENGINIRAVDIDKVYRDVWREKKAEHPTYGIHHNIEPRDWWNDFVVRVLLKAGCNNTADKLSEVSSKVWKHYNDDAKNCWDILPHSAHVLQAIKSKGYKIGVISNFDERLPRTLESLDLLTYFDFLVTCVTANCAKPGRKIFEEALKVGKVSAKECLHIGDDVKEDYFAARDLGMNAVLLDREQKVSAKNNISECIPKKHIVTDIQSILYVLQEIG